jgi:hypothetical protein
MNFCHMTMGAILFIERTWHFHTQE